MCRLTNHPSSPDFQGSRWGTGQGGGPLVNIVLGETAAALFPRDANRRGRPIFPIEHFTPSIWLHWGDIQVTPALALVYSSSGRRRRSHSPNG
jgi:hypothetical protein